MTLRQRELDFLHDIKNDIHEFNEQNQTKFREVFHLIEGITKDVSSLKHRINHESSENPSSQIQLSRSDPEYPVTHSLNNAFEMKEDQINIEGMITLSE